MSGSRVKARRKVRAAIDAATPRCPHSRRFDARADECTQCLGTTEVTRAPVHTYVPPIDDAPIGRPTRESTPRASTITLGDLAIRLRCSYVEARDVHAPEIKSRESRESTLLYPLRAFDARAVEEYAAKLAANTLAPAPALPDVPITTSQAARIVGVDPSVFVRCHVGKLDHYRDEHGHRIFSRALVLDYAQRRAKRQARVAAEVVP